MRRCLFALLCAVVIAGAGWAKRTSSDIRRERQATERKIGDTRRQLKSADEKTRLQLNELTAIEGEIRHNAERLSELTAEHDSLKRINALLEDTVAKARRRVASLKESRAAALRAARRQRQTAVSTAAFIFSAKSVNEAMRRNTYLRDLARWLDSSAVDVDRAVKVLDARNRQLDSARTVLRANMQRVNAEKNALEQNNRKAQLAIASLKKQTRSLEKVLKEQQNKAAALDRELNRLIEEEARKAAAEEKRRKEEEARRKQAESKDKAKEKNKKSEKPAAAKKSESAPASVPASTEPFEAMKGRLPMPLDKPAKVAVPFGLQSHAEYSKVKVQNNGVDFETQAGASARAVHPGTVSMIIVMDGYHNVVLVRHGEYITVYAGLDEIKVRKGQTLSAGELLGTVWSDPTDGNRSRLHFEVRHEKDKLDPAQWLKMR